MASSWWLLALCCILGTLTSALPTKKPAPPADDVIESQRASSDGGQTAELQHWRESLLPRADSLERHLGQYERAAVFMADEDLFPVHLCEESSLNRMRHALAFLPRDAVLRALLMVTLMQSEGCRKGALHTATKLRELIKSSHDVIPNNDVTSKQEQAPSTDSDEDKMKEGGQAGKDHCSAVDECGWRGVAEVRAIMADEADLLLLYDTVAAAVFRASGRTRLARALGLDLLQDLQDDPHKPLHPRLKRYLYGNPMAQHMRDGGVIDSEADLQRIIGMLPVPYVSAAYNTATGAYYYWQGDTDLATSRFISAGLDLAVPPLLRPIIGKMGPLAQRGTEWLARQGIYGMSGYK